MYECFLEIGFEAELNTSENPELMELATELCNEHPATRDAAIAELREMIYGELSSILHILVVTILSTLFF